LPNACFNIFSPHMRLGKKMNVSIQQL
jgi:hypothetical protein